MKPDSDRGSSSSHTRLDDTGLNVNDSDCQWRLTIILILTELTHYTDKFRFEKRFIGSEQYRYCSWKQFISQLKDIGLAINSRLTYDILDSRRRGFV